MSNKLPFDLEKSDLSYPKDYKERVIHTIELYEVERAGWVIATLGISSGNKYAARTYSVDANGKVWRVGKGPHVKQTITAYVTEKSAKRLAELIRLHNSGAIEANTIRDRISSRRAQGQINRMKGMSSWRW